MSYDSTQVNVKGRRINVPSILVGDRTVIVRGKWIRMAVVHQEDWMEGEPVEDPIRFIQRLTDLKLEADIFSFSRRLPETSQKYPFHFELDNVAAIPITTFDDWWQKRLSRKTRQEVSRAERLGVIVKPVPWDEDLIGSIVTLFNEIPTKQGLPFAHYGKDHATVKKDVSSYSDRSAFIGAFYENQLIGYLKMVYMGKSASILNIISNDAHFERRPSNALLAKAVKICEEKGVQYLQYGKFIYGKKTKCTLTEFKRRNGFEKITFPRYYVPLTRRGSIIMKLKLHLGLLDILPGSLISPLIRLRSAAYLMLVRPLRSAIGLVRRRRSSRTRRG